jgi:hypothetical protein
MSGVPLLLMDVTALRKMRFQTRVGNHCAETSTPVLKPQSSGRNYK